MDYILVKEAEMLNAFRTVATELLTSKGSTMPPNEPLYYSREELCELLHVNYGTLWRYEKAGLIKKEKVGRRNLYLRSEINESISTGKLAKYIRK